MTSGRHSAKLSEGRFEQAWERAHVPVGEVQIVRQKSRLHGVRQSTLPERTGSFTRICHPGLRLDNQQAASVPVAELGSTITKVLFLLLSPRRCFFNVEPAHATRGTRIHIPLTHAVHQETLLQPQLPTNQLLNRRGRDSGLVQVCFATILLLDHQFA